MHTHTFGGTTTTATTRPLAPALALSLAKRLGSTSILFTKCVLPIFLFFFFFQELITVQWLAGWWTGHTLLLLLLMVGTVGVAQQCLIFWSSGSIISVLLLLLLLSEKGHKAAAAAAATHVVVMRETQFSLLEWSLFSFTIPPFQCTAAAAVCLCVLMFVSLSFSFSFFYDSQQSICATAAPKGTLYFNFCLAVVNEKLLSSSFSLLLSCSRDSRLMSLGSIISTLLYSEL